MASQSGYCQLKGSVHPQFDCGSGDLLYMSIAGQKMLVLNTNRVAADLLDRRGAIYSGRPRLISKSCHQFLQHSAQLSLYGSVAFEIFTGGLMVPFAPFGETCVQVSSTFAVAWHSC